VILTILVLVLLSLKFHSKHTSNFYSKVNQLKERPSIEYESNSCEKLKAQNQIAVWTFLTDDVNYAISAVKLIKSIRANTKSVYYDTNAMELFEKPLANSTRDILVQAGWTLCHARRIAPRDEEQTYPRFRDQFTKLVLWNFTQYKAHIYFDSDTFIVGNIDDLLVSYHKLNDDNYRLGVTRDIKASVWLETFNMGVFVIKPSVEEFKRLIMLKENPEFEFETAMSEQGFLNVVYEKKWYEIGFKYNANLAVYTQQHDFWKRRESNIRVIHYTMKKPWACDDSYHLVCEIWQKYTA